MMEAYYYNERQTLFCVLSCSESDGTIKVNPALKVAYLILIHVFQAEERMRQEEEERRQKAAAQRRLEAEKARSTSSGGGQHKKKGKHKEDKQQKSVAPAAAGGPSGDDALRESQAKANSKGKQRLKDAQPENQAEKFGNLISQELMASSGKIATTKQAVTQAAAPPTRVGKATTSLALTNSKVLKKSAEVFQPPAHLMRSLAEQTMQQASSRASAPPLATSPAPLPTLGGQPNSPTAKKAKRRLAPGTQSQLPAQRKLLLQQPQEPQQVELQRRLEAQQEVAKQIKEAEEFARQRAQMRQQQQSQVQPLQQTQNLQQQKQELLQQQAQQKQQQTQQTQQPQKLQQQQTSQKQVTAPRQPAAGKQNPTPPQQSKPATNGVAGQHLSIGANHGKVVNGIGATTKGPQPLASASPSGVSEAPRGKQLPSGTNGLTALENRARIANSGQRTSTDHQEQMEQASMILTQLHVFMESLKFARKKDNKEQKVVYEMVIDEVFPNRELVKNVQKMSQ